MNCFSSSNRNLRILGSFCKNMYMYLSSTDSEKHALIWKSQTCRSLSELILPKNNIGDRGAEAIGKSLAKNKYLTHLDVSLNAFGDYGATGMAKGINLNSNLSFVDLSQNR